MSSSCWYRQFGECCFGCVKAPRSPRASMKKRAKRHWQSDNFCSADFPIVHFICQNRAPKFYNMHFHQAIWSMLSYAVAMAVLCSLFCMWAANSQGFELLLILVTANLTPILDVIKLFRNLINREDSWSLQDFAQIIHSLDLTVSSHDI